jgi:6-pyruvoyl-tetrahydropterin synthase
MKYIFDRDERTFTKDIDDAKLKVCDNLLNNLLNSIYTHIDYLIDLEQEEEYEICEHIYFKMKEEINKTRYELIDVVLKRHFIDELKYQDFRNAFEKKMLFYLDKIIQEQRNYRIKN